MLILPFNMSRRYSDILLMSGMPELYAEKLHFQGLESDGLQDFIPLLSD